MKIFYACRLVNRGYEALLNKLLLMILLVFMASQNLQANESVLTSDIDKASLKAANVQSIFVKGQVLNSQVPPDAIHGVTVKVKGTAKGTTTDENGYFTMEVSMGDVLVFTSVGFVEQEYTVNQSVENLKIILEEELSSLEEVVVVGYGTQKKKDLTGSVHRLDAEKFQRAPNTNFLEMLNGTVAGFQSNQGTSAQGGGSMLIRGTTSLKASNNPLIVLDGVIYNGVVTDINPTDIETVDILKDASAAAVYGARSASGVIIITTKRGKSGSPSLEFSSKIGVSSKTDNMRPFTPEEYLYNRGVDSYQTYKNKPLYYYMSPHDLPSGVTLEDWKNLDATPSDDVVDMWLNRLRFTNTEKRNYLAGKTTDWFDEIFRHGLRQDYDMSVSGSGNASYFVSAGYTKNQGITLGDDFDILRAKVNLDLEATSFLNFSISSSFSSRNHGFTAANINDAAGASPYGEIYDEAGKMTWYSNEDITSPNPLLYYTYRDKYNPVATLFNNISAELKLPFDIRFRSTLTSNQRWVKDYSFDPTETAAGYNNNGSGRRSTTSHNEWMLDNIVTWGKSLRDKHHINATFLFNAEQLKSWNEVMTNVQFAPNDNLSYHSIQSGTNPTVSSNDVYSTGSALMGRINYNFDDRYLVTATIRRDGYSAFGQNMPYATFPSAAFAWRISQEQFMTKSWIDDLKLRLSWGINGNRDIGAYDALARLATSNYIYGTQLASGVYTNTMENRNLKWEKTEAYNIGIDFSLFKSRLSGNIDAYVSKTHDLLVNRSLPSIIGYNSVAANLGLLQNKGVELTLTAKPVEFKSNLSWRTTLNLAFNRNKIVSLYGDFVDVYDNSGNVAGSREADDVTNQWFIGKSVHEIWDYERLGIWQLGEEQEAARYGKTPGDVKFKDQNNDGTWTPMEDKVFLGSKVPLYNIGLMNDFQFLNSFELSFFIRADLGHYGNNPLYRSTSWIDRHNIYYAPYWTEENPSDEYPKLRTEVNNPSYGVWVSRSFVRLQDITLSYLLPQAITNKLNANRFTVYANMRNALTFSKWNNWDPESLTAPMPKFLTFGLTLKF